MTKRGAKTSPEARAIRKNSIRLTRLMADQEPMAGGCANWTAGIVLALCDRGVDARHVIGSYGIDPTELGPETALSGSQCIHHWIELPTGDLLDPTSAQFGLPECLVLGPEDSRRGQYRGAVIVDAEQAEKFRSMVEDVGELVKVMQPLMLGKGVDPSMVEPRS